MKNLILFILLIISSSLFSQEFSINNKFPTILILKQRPVLSNCMPLGILAIEQESISSRNGFFVKLLPKENYKGEVFCSIAFDDGISGDFRFLLDDKDNRPIISASVSEKYNFLDNKLAEFSAYKSEKINLTEMSFTGGFWQKDIFFTVLKKYLSPNGYFIHEIELKNETGKDFEIGFSEQEKRIFVVDRLDNFRIKSNEKIFISILSEKIDFLSLSEFFLITEKKQKEGK